MVIIMIEEIGMTTIKKAYGEDVFFLDIIVDKTEFEGDIIPLNSPACVGVEYDLSEWYSEPEETDDEDRLGVVKNLMYQFGFFRDEKNPWWLLLSR